MNGKIYKITNTVNNKIYIGQTTSSIEQRFGQHKYLSRQNHGTQLHKAMKEFGIENFIIELLEENIDSIAELNAKEIYYIVKLNAKNDYNGTWGGGSYTRSPKRKNKRVFNKELNEKNENEILLHKSFNEIIPPSITLNRLRFIILVLGRMKKENSSSILISRDEDFHYVSDSESTHFSLLTNLSNFIVDDLNSFNSEYSIFKEIEIDKLYETIKFTLTKQAEWLIDSNYSNYVIVNLSHLRPMTKKQSIFLYLTLSEMKQSGKREISTSDLTKKLLTPKSYSSESKVFHSRILYPALKEIKILCSRLECEKLKEGKVITAYKFKYF